MRVPFGVAAAIFSAAATALAGAAVSTPRAASNVRAELLEVPLSPNLGGDTTRIVASDKAFSFLAANALPERQRPFFFGNRLFNTNWTEFPSSVESFDGLGPIFNRNSCSGCHVRDGRGRPPEAGEPMESMLVRLSGPNDPAAPHPVYSDQLNDRAILGVAPEGRALIAYEEIEGSYGDGAPYSLLLPSYRFADLTLGALDGVAFSPRVAPAVIGLGLLEAVPVTTLQALADPDDLDGDGISGRVNLVPAYDGSEAVGRFGWKANVATLREQAAGAALGDIGLTTSMLPQQNCASTQSDCLSALGQPAPEISDSFLDRLVIYLQTLAVPIARDLDDPEAERGQALFGELGCASCHMPTLQTDESAALPELRNQTFHPFTDLPLHDMGEGLADNRPDGLASGREWRTPPLWGLGLQEEVSRHDRLLHDGRARGIAEAILWHGGEAEAAREAFRNASAEDREALLEFLNSL